MVFIVKKHMTKEAHNQGMKTGITLIMCLFIFIFSACGKDETSIHALQDNSSLEEWEKSIENDNLSETMVFPAIEETDTEIIIAETPPAIIEEPKTMEIIMVGDMLMHTKVVEKGLQEDGSYNFDFLFENVGDRIQNADLAIVNQETILGGKELGLSGYPRFNSPYELGDAEVKAGFDVILHATNHALDAQKIGLLNCIHFWENNYPEISYLGIYESKQDRDEKIFLYTQNDITVAVLNYTYSTNGIATPEDMPFAVNYLDEKQMKEDIQKADELADFIIVCPHWGTEYKLDVSKSQKKWTQFFLENGVDLVIGTHPHVIEPVEWVSDENGNEMLVYYSIGNFVNGTSGTGAGVANRMIGGMADIVLEKNDDKVVIQSYEAIPLVCHWSEEEITTYYLQDYTEEMALENGIIKQDPDFSLEGCKALVLEVWGE